MWPAVLKEDELAGGQRHTHREEAKWLDSPTEETRRLETHTHLEKTKCTGTWAVEINQKMSEAGCTGLQEMERYAEIC
ncbi:hypothetical protein BY996DRAFT_6470737 [Phakopsora pachyrhizi]|nr:hypothetical protein BY996DRAFT_6470737 [Phakopsora pachyrhizi]